LQCCGTSRENDSCERTFAEADLGFGAGGWHEERTEEVGEIGIVANDQKVIAAGVFAEKSLEVFEGSFGGERGGVENLGFVTGLGADQGGGLQAALERARDDEVELNVQGVEHVSELQTMLFAFLIKGALGIEHWIGTAKTGAGVSKDVQIHNLLTF
jgi:hypothetical protein